MLTFLRKYFWFSGYLSRKDYLYSVVILISMYAINIFLIIKVKQSLSNPNMMAALTANLDSLKGFPLGWFLLFPSMKRIRSMGHNGLWILVPFVNLWLMFMGFISIKPVVTSMSKPSNHSKPGSLIVFCSYVFLVTITFIGSHPSGMRTLVNKTLSGKEFLEKKHQNDTCFLQIQAIQKAIQEQPTSREMIISYVDSIDTLIILYKKSLSLTQYIQDKILELLDKPMSDKNKIELRNICQEGVIKNVSVLPEFRKKYATWTELEITALLSRKEYYQSSLNGETNQTQNYLLNKWDQNEQLLIQYNKTLNDVQSRLNSIP